MLRHKKLKHQTQNVVRIQTKLRLVRLKPGIGTLYAVLSENGSGPFYISRDPHASRYVSAYFYASNHGYM